MYFVVLYSIYCVPFRADNNIYWANRKIDPSPFYVIDTIIINGPQKDIAHLGKFHEIIVSMDSSLYVTCPKSLFRIV